MYFKGYGHSHELQELLCRDVSSWEKELGAEHTTGLLTPSPRKDAKCYKVLSEECVAFGEWSEHEDWIDTGFTHLGYGVTESSEAEVSGHRILMTLVG